MEDGSDPIFGPGDRYRLLAMGGALGAVESQGPCGGRLVERRVVAPHDPRRTLHRSGPRHIQVAQRTPDLGEAPVGRSHPKVGVGRGTRGGAVANGHRAAFSGGCCWNSDLSTECERQSSAQRSQGVCVCV